MTKSDLELILTALTYVGKPKDAMEQSDYDLARTAIDIVTKQINEEQPAQEPMYFALTKDHTWLSITEKQYNNLKPEYKMKCYTHPCALAHTAPSWNELSEVEINALADFWNISDIDIKEFIKKIERMSREMNT